VGGAVQSASEMNSFLRHPSELFQAHHLEATAVGSGWDAPKLMKRLPTRPFPDSLMAGTQIEVVSVRQ